ncbi:MAG: DNA gyrase modulator, partial [Halobacteriota archaeon]|nr:DNA gyrase modulator [Halobacteriota archaeon]
MVLEELYEVGREALNVGERSGADELEIFCISGKSSNIEIVKDEINLARVSFERGAGIRALCGKSIGFSSTNDFEKIDQSVVNAIKCAEVSDADGDGD